MDYRRLTDSDMDMLWELQRAYKAEIEENKPAERDKERLKDAVNRNLIQFYGAWDEGILAGVCSVTVGFSTFQYAASGVFEDFYIRPPYRHKGIARELVKFARAESGVSSLTVGCADCDMPMYESLGFSVRLGNLLAFD